MFPATRLEEERASFRRRPYSHDSGAWGYSRRRGVCVLGVRSRWERTVAHLASFLCESQAAAEAAELAAVALGGLTFAVELEVGGGLALLYEAESCFAGGVGFAVEGLGDRGGT